ncbi:MAG: efflux RND transporter permease subunit [Planctomycetes bacterium]|nr:efflux RND transporter permease subunit [Planctomycetota bacterium]
MCGIAGRNGIILVSHYRHLEREEGGPFGREFVLRGAEERSSPILMTASCAAFALLPLVLAGEAPGHEIEYPMALVILGGLATSTRLNLFFLPSLYLAFAGRRRASEREGS